MNGQARSGNVPSTSAPQFSDAECAQPGVDPDVFFPANSIKLRQAQKSCDACPVPHLCIEAREALPRPSVHGVWHGILFVGGFPRRTPRGNRTRRGRA